MTEWVPVIDISQHQGNVDFAKMRGMGVPGLILRIAHGMTLDTRVEQYYPAAVAAGFDPDEIGFYPFLNPKRGSGAQSAAFAVAAIRNITGREEFLYMLDIENYRNESPNVGQAPVYGPAYAAYIREHINTVNLMAPKARVIGYTNRAYWNGKVPGTAEEWVGDDTLAGELDWIVARYPAYSLAAYQRRPLPATPDGWDEWAFNAAPDGPFPPRGGKWAAWQFSAGYNRQGPVYGASSSDLDLNFVHPEAWARWTGKTVPPLPPPTPIGDDMPAFISNKTAGKYGAAPSPQGGCTIWEMEHRTKVALSFEAWVAYGQPFGIALEDSILDGIPDYVESSGTVDDVAREMATRNAAALSDVRMGGQRIADAGGH